MRREAMKENVAAAVLKGAVAGAVGVWALDRVTWYLWNREDPAAIARELRARPRGMDPAHVMANRAANGLGRRLTPRQPHPAGIAAHFALGVVPGALYGALRHRSGGVRPGRGLLFGLALFILQDEIANWLLGMSGSPAQYPWQAHARGVAGHLAYGAATEMTLGLLDEAL